MNVKKTSFKLTKATQVFEKCILAHMDIPRTTFHRRAIDYFLDNGAEMYPPLLIKKGHPGYIKRTEMEQIYLDEAREQRLLEVAEQYGCNIGTVLFQAIMTYCSVVGPVVLGDEKIDMIFNVKE